MTTTTTTTVAPFAVIEVTRDREYHVLDSLGQLVGVCATLADASGLAAEARLAEAERIYGCALAALDSAGTHLAGMTPDPKRVAEIARVVKCVRGASDPWYVRTTDQEASLEDEGPSRPPTD